MWTCLSFPSLFSTHIHSKHVPKCNIKCFTCFRTTYVTLFRTYSLLTYFLDSIFASTYLNKNYTWMPFDGTWIFHCLSLTTTARFSYLPNPSAICACHPSLAIPRRHPNVSEHLVMGISSVVQAHSCYIQLKTGDEILLYNYIYILSWQKPICDCLRMEFEWEKIKILWRMRTTLDCDDYYMSIYHSHNPSNNTI